MQFLFQIFASLLVIAGSVRVLRIQQLVRWGRMTPEEQVQAWRSSQILLTVSVVVQVTAVAFWVL